MLVLYVIYGVLSVAHSNNCEYDSCFAVFGCDLAWVEFTHIIQGYFTGLGASHDDCPSASEATLNYMGKYFTWVQ